MCIHLDMVHFVQPAGFWSAYEFCTRLVFITGVVFGRGWVLGDVKELEKWRLTA